MANPVTISYAGTPSTSVYLTLLNKTASSTIHARSTSSIVEAYAGMYEYAIADLTQDTIARWDEGDATVYADELIPLISGTGGGGGGVTLPIHESDVSNLVADLASINTTLATLGGLGGYVPIVLLGPDGSPNGTLHAAPQTVVLTPDGSVYTKSLGNDAEGWILTQQG